MELTKGKKTLEPVAEELFLMLHEELRRRQLETKDRLARECAAEPHACRTLFSNR
jgi:hypothetical protein